MDTCDLLYADQLGLTGSTIQLKCPAKLAPRRSLWFYTNGTQSVYLTENGYINNDTLSPELYRRLSVSGNHSIGEYHLNIADIRKSDEGKYECIVGKDIGTVFLTVIVGPTALIIDNVTPDNKVPGIEGQYMTLKCTAVGGQPAPDVNLVILGLNYTGKQSAHHTFNPQRLNDGSTVTCQAGYKEIQHYPLNTTTHIHLKLKPVITPFSPDTVSTEETKVFAISCQATGSRPAAYIYWLLGPQRTNITTNSTSQSNKESSTDTYNVTSYLKYRVDRKYNEQTLICIAVNVAGSMETSLTLDVKYAPGVTVENETFPLTQLSRQIQSTLDGNPIVNTCIWHHRSQYGEHIRYFSDNNQILTLPTVSEDERYQDTGEYVCTAADNGVIGINGQLKQTGSGYVISNGKVYFPQITATNDV
ncbi:kin of IRRE-like protein 3 [Mytilus californianus]|uniref:kin of IRRE-like protein 3 n=1 Tax=Mytilus californianus TaxID=6549 RepID=UPI002248315C|nr:kin of IRRE-like protein 3 [Mytilus californianus]